MQLHNNATPGHCCVCGNPDNRSLCKKCRVTWADAAGKLPRWLAALQGMQRRDSDRHRRNLQRVARGHPRTGRIGPPEAFGVMLVSLEAARHRGDRGSAFISVMDTIPSTHLDRDRYPRQRYQRQNDD